MMNQFLFILLMLSLTACDYQQRATGIVLDKDSKQPLTGVFIHHGLGEVVDPVDKIVKNHSDSSGSFLITYYTTYVFSAPDLKVTFSKQGYESARVTLPGRTQNDTIYMERSK